MMATSPDVDLVAWTAHHQLSRMISARANAGNFGKPAKPRSTELSISLCTKDVDPNIPVLQRAKAEYAKLH
jgi:hypothetical protein